MRQRRKKRMITLIPALILALIPGLISGAASEWMAQDEGLTLESIYVQEQRITYLELKTQQAEKMPVYAAPFENAWRGGKGKAAVSTQQAFRLLGTAQNGDWTWIEYNIIAGERRIGWIRTGLQPMEYETNCFPADGTLLRIETETYLTDDPRGGQRIIRQLQPGDEVIGLGRIETGDDSFSGWIYAETEIDGQPAWGFLPDGTAAKIPSYTIEGDTVTYREGITTVGMTATEESMEYSETGSYETIWRSFGPGEIRGDSIAKDWDDFPEGVNRVIYPSTLKILGGEALLFGRWKEIVLPAHPESCDGYAFYGLHAEKLIFPETYTGTVFLDDHCTIDAFEAAEGNPAYRTVDGVLYSADGKTLIRYPNGRKDEHFDVPAGVETIRSSAFADDDMQLPLKTISLPMGLKEIEKWAFSGCGRLHSLTVPLTVTRLSPDAFANCVSLERLSLPAGQTAIFDDDWARMADFSVYNGDNGETIVPAAPRR